MAVAILFTFDGSMTSEKYGQIMREAFNDQIAPGVISHTAGPLDDGWYAFDVYESQAVADGMTTGVVGGVEAMGVKAPHVTTFQVARALVKSS